MYNIIPAINNLPVVGQSTGSNIVYYIYKIKSAKELIVSKV